MILKPALEKKFFQLLKALTAYANDQHEILGYHFEQSPRNLQYDEEKNLILDRVWGDTAIIDGFIEKNPANLSRHDLGAIADWKYALRGEFIIYNHEDGYSHFLKDGLAYAVIGLSKEISSMLNEVPCFVSTTLLPFEGQIVYASSI